MGSGHNLSASYHWPKETEGIAILAIMTNINANIQYIYMYI
jgi:hypothetical protein